MPHAYLVRSGFETKSGPLSATISKLPPGSPYRYWSWETYVELPPFEEDLEDESPGFTNVLVCEGYSGLHLTRDEAAKRGLRHGSTVTCFIATYANGSQVEGGVDPQFKFRVDLEVHVRENEEEGIVKVRSDDPTCYVGGVEFFQHFDIQLDSENLLEADGDGHLTAFAKVQVKGHSLLLKKKASVNQTCEPI